MLDVSPTLIPLEPVGEVRLVRVLIVGVRERSRGMVEIGVVVRVEVVARRKLLAVVDDRSCCVRVRDMIAEARLGTERVMLLLRVRDVTPELAADRVRDVVDGTVTRRTVPDVRGRETVGLGLAVRDLDGVLDRMGLAGEAPRELGATREREGAGELRDGAAALSSLLELPLRLREYAATTPRRGNKSDFPSIEKDRCPEASCASALTNPTPGGKNISAPASTTTILFIGFALLSTSCLIIALQLKGPQVVLDLSLFSTGKKLMLFNAPLPSDGSRARACWTFLLKTPHTRV